LTFDDYAYFKEKLREAVPRLGDEEVDKIVKVVTEEICDLCYGPMPCYCHPAYDI